MGTREQKIQLGFAYFCTWKMEFEALGLRIGHKDQGNKLKILNAKHFYLLLPSVPRLIKSDEN